VGFPHVPPERIVDLPAFTIDITEVTNEMFSLLTVMPFTGIPPSSYAGRAQRLPAAAGRRRPVTFVDRHQARAFCRYLGKELPTSEQWVKAMRGGIELDGRPNPHPRRVLPGGPGVVPGAIAIARAAAGPADVATHPLDRSPYGVFDLAGNVMEWTSTQNADGPVVRGAGWENATYENVTSFMAIENPRNAYTDAAELGFRCAGPPPPP
jgi:formylglycine-generating enzyme required for sulfatase activity